MNQNIMEGILRQRAKRGRVAMRFLVMAAIALALYPSESWAMAKRPPVKVEISVRGTLAPPQTEPPWYLSDLLKEALSHNPELHVYEARSQAAKARVWKELSWDDTMVGVDFEGIPRGRIDADRAMDREWMISQKIPFPGKRFLRGRVAAKEAKMAEADWQAKEREIVSEVKKAYFEYFLTEHEIKLHEETKQILERLSKSAESRYATGKTPYHEVLRAHTKLATLTNEVARHYQERDTALARLNALLGREATAPLSLGLSVPAHDFSYTPEDLMQRALKSSPELHAMRYGFEAAKTDVARAWMELLPDAQVRIEARKFSGEGKIREYDQFFGFEVPVFSLLGRAGEIKEKRAEKKAAVASLENMKNLILFEVQKALAEFETHDRTARLYQSSVVPQAESLLESSLADYEGGRGDFKAVMEAQETLTEFRHHYFVALAMREQSFAGLERVVGVELKGGAVQ